MSFVRIENYYRMTSIILIAFWFIILLFQLLLLSLHWSDSYPHRSRLLSDTVEALMCLQDWL